MGPYKGEKKTLQSNIPHERSYKVLKIILANKAMNIKRMAYHYKMCLFLEMQR